MAAGPGGAYAVLRVGTELHVLQAGQRAGELKLISIAQDRVALQAGSTKIEVLIDQQSNTAGRADK